MIRNILIGGALTLAPMAQAQAMKVIGVGNKSCGSWTEARSISQSNPDQQYIIGARVAGYVAASADIIKIDLIKNIDADAMDSYIDNYCHSHPLDDIFTASFSLAQELRRREAPLIAPKHRHTP